MVGSTDKDGNALNEVGMIWAPLMNDNGILRESTVIKRADGAYPRVKMTIGFCFSCSRV